MGADPRSKEYAEAIFLADRAYLAKAITLIESKHPQDRRAAQELLGLCLSKTKSTKSLRIGITGPPGAGKSTFIESFGNFLIHNYGKRIAVLAIDPSSTENKGSILGDKTRMASLAVHPNAFIRPSPSSGSLGGLSFRTREVMFLCEAAGYDTIFIETIGVGQSQVDVRSMVDLLILVSFAGGGDILQGMKRGIMEAIDLVLVNKADGSNIKASQKTRSEYKAALSLRQKKASAWEAQALLCSALENKGLEAIQESIEAYCKISKANSYFHSFRKQQGFAWLRERLQEEFSFYTEKLLQEFQTNPAYAAKQEALLKGQIAPMELVKELLQKYSLS